MVGLAENIQACLRDFQTGTASMARKRYLASTARGFYGFCLLTSQDRCLTSALLPGGQYARGQVLLFTTDKTDIF